MSQVERIIADRSRHAGFDSFLWDSLYERIRILRDTSLERLIARIGYIDKNIQFLNESVVWNDLIPAENGWKSPWWWFRARHFTLFEMRSRGLQYIPTSDVGRAPKLYRDFSKRARPSIVRIGKIIHLKELIEGKIRFAPASGFVAPFLYDSQKDNEISRHSFVPGSQFNFINPDGITYPLDGEIELSISRMHVARGKSVVRPYWLLCFSTEPDHRLMDDFVLENRDESGYLIIYQVEKFHRRLAESLVKMDFDCGRVEVNYYDEYLALHGGLPGHVIGSKPLRFACQRELRFFLTTKNEHQLYKSDDAAVFVNVGKILDIAGIFDHRGKKICGIGGKNLFRNHTQFLSANL